jgi:serine/alanine adding enzyme
MDLTGPPVTADMTPEQKQTFKDILKNPELAAIGKKLPYCSEQDALALIPLLHQYLALEATQSQQQDLGRGLSRKIGEAKKQGTSAESLIAEMQANSAKLKKTRDDLLLVEQRILPFITQEAQVPRQSPSAAGQTLGRNYPDPSADPEIKISTLQDDTSAWDEYVNANPATSLYHLAAWRDVIKKSFNHDSVYLFAHAGDMKVKGVLPLVRLKSRLFGDFMVSMPYFNYGGAVADHPSIEARLVSTANTLAADSGVDHIEYRDDIVKADTAERKDKVNMILPLPAEPDALWQSFSPKLRSQIKRPQRENTQVVHGRSELLDDFYRVFATNMRDLGTPVYGKDFFRNILEAFPLQSSIMTVRLDNHPVAAAFLLGYRETLEIPWASTLRNVNQISVNMLMYWEILSFAIKQKYKYFDFGRSSIDSGTYKFKKQWGAQPKQLYWHYWLNNRDMPTLNPTNPKYKIMINIWKRLPLWVTKLIGPAIVKNLP